MIISKLTIQNFRNFGDNFDIRFKNYNLIVGENNSGKSNLLQALCLLFSQDIFVLRSRVLEQEDFNYSTLNSFRDNLLEGKDLDKLELPEIKISVELINLNKEQKSIAGDWFVDQTLETASITYLYKPHSTLAAQEWIKTSHEQIKEKLSDGKSIEDIKSLIDLPINLYEYVIYGGDDESNKCDPYFLRMFKIEVLDALRDAKKELIASNDYRLLFRILNNKNKTFFEDIKSALQTLDLIVRDNPALKEVKNDIKSLLTELSLDSSISEEKVDFLFSKLEHSEVLKKLSLQYGHNPISIERNGMGKNNLLYLSLVISQLIDEDENKKSPTYFRLLGIEEPEAHLHSHLEDHLSKGIKMQINNKKKVDTIRENIQIITTSHSTHFTSGSSLDDITILYRAEDGNTAKHKLLDGFGNSASDKDTIRYLEKYLDATKSTMLFARKLLLVEGISEQILLPKLFELHTQKTLAKIGCSVINVNGVAFKHFLKIIRNGFFLKVVVITDKDTEKKTENRAADLKTGFEIENGVIKISISNMQTFEKDIINSNKSSAGKKYLLEAISKTKPISGRSLAVEFATEDIDVDKFFGEIEEYKSEFAMDLLEILNKTSEGFSIPPYLIEGFNSLYGTTT